MDTRESLRGAGGSFMAQYAGHLHVNGLKVLDGIHYVTTSGLTTYPGEYRLVTVTGDSIAHMMAAEEALRKAERRIGKQKEGDLSYAISGPLHYIW
jgi:hypothetical protein